MKTLADLKRDLTIGKTITLIEANGPAHRFLNIPRYVVAVQSNGVQISPDKETKKGSFLDLPKASLMEYDGKSLKIYEPGLRALTAQEQRIYDNMPSKRKENEQKCINDALTDGSSMYWADKSYLADAGMEYLSGSKEVRGMYWDYNNKQVRDNSIKGCLSLSYIIQ